MVMATTVIDIVMMMTMIFHDHDEVMMTSMMMCKNDVYDDDKNIDIVSLIVCSKRASTNA